MDCRALNFPIPIKYLLGTLLSKLKIKCRLLQCKCIKILPNAASLVSTRALLGDTAVVAAAMAEGVADSRDVELVLFFGAFTDSDPVKRL